MDIYDIHGNLISETWKAEFRGFFMGEGCLWFGRNWRKAHKPKELRLTHKNSPEGYFYYTTQAVVSLRKDDLPVLEDIQSVLGGIINFRYNFIGHPNCKPSARWYIGSKIDCIRLADILFETQLPAKKMLELPLWREALRIRKIVGQRFTDEERTRLAEIMEEIRAIRKFKVQ